MAKIVTFTAEGCGAFPFDLLLRRCWPVDAASVQAMAASGCRRVRLEILSDVGPDFDLWRASGWRVVLEALRDV